MIIQQPPTTSLLRLIALYSNPTSGLSPLPSASKHPILPKDKDYYYYYYYYHYHYYYYYYYYY